MHYKCLTHHVWRTIPPRFELYSCSENPVETSISLYQLTPQNLSIEICVQKNVYIHIYVKIALTKKKKNK